MWHSDHDVLHAEVRRAIDEHLHAGDERLTALQHDRGSGFMHGRSGIMGGLA